MTPRRKPTDTADPMRHCAFCGLIFSLDDLDNPSACPVFRDGDKRARRSCWSCTSDALRLCFEEGRIHGQLALVTNRDLDQHVPAKILDPSAPRTTDEHEHCYAEFHRCDGGGPGEAQRYREAAT